MKKTIAFISLFAMLVLLFCGCPKLYPVPSGGDIRFHDIAITIPFAFIGDSTQSSDEMWVFERGGYSEYILLSGKPTDETDYEAGLISYGELMVSRGATANWVSSGDTDGVISEYDLQDMHCRELFFYHNGYEYAVALRDGTEETFNELIDSIAFLEAAEEKTE